MKIDISCIRETHDKFGLWRDKGNVNFPTRMRSEIGLGESMVNMKTTANSARSKELRNQPMDSTMSAITIEIQMNARVGNRRDVRRRVNKMKTTGDQRQKAVLKDGRGSSGE